MVEQPPPRMHRLSDPTLVHILAGMCHQWDRQTAGYGRLSFEPPEI